MGQTADNVIPKPGKSRSGNSKSRSQPHADRSSALLTIISTNLRRMRTRQGHSLERLANLAGVSRAMLSQIETGKSVPTISLLLKVANALGVPIAAGVAYPLFGLQLSPMLASAAMAVSSVSVIGNALRLRRVAL